MSRYAVDFSCQHPEDLEDMSTTLKKPKSPPKKVEMPVTQNKMAETTVEVLKKDRARRDQYVNDPWTPKKKK